MRIGEVAERAGIAVPTLRSWERRYQLLEPDRTPGGHRVYGSEDLARVLAVRDLVSRGWQVREAARMVVEGRVPEEPEPEPVPDPAELSQQLWATIDAFDAAAAGRLLDEGMRRLGVGQTLDGVVVPVLRELGATWRESDRAIAREHLGSQLIRGRLMDLLREPGLRTKGTVVAVAPRGEYHDIGTLMAAVRLSSVGWQVRFLGAHTPPSVLGAAVQEVRPTVLLIGAQLTRPAREFLRGLRTGGNAGVVFGGTGFDKVRGELPRRAAVHTGAYDDLPLLVDQLLSGAGAR